MIVLDSTMYNFGSLDKAVEYVSRRVFGDDKRKISKRTYSRYLSEIRSGDFAREWFSDYAVEGYRLEHIKLMSLSYFLRERILNMIEDEIKEPAWNRDKRLIKDLQTQLVEVCEMTSELSAGVPVVAEIEARYQSYEDRIKELQEKLFRAENREVIQRVEMGH